MVDDFIQNIARGGTTEINALSQSPVRQSPPSPEPAPVPTAAIPPTLLENDPLMLVNKKNEPVSSSNFISIIESKGFQLNKTLAQQQQASKPKHTTRPPSGAAMIDSDEEVDREVASFTIAATSDSTRIVNPAAINSEDEDDDDTYMSHQQKLVPMSLDLLLEQIQQSGPTLTTANKVSVSDANDDDDDEVEDGDNYVAPLEIVDSDTE